MEDTEERTRRGETRPWYRVPSRGLSVNSRRIADAVDNAEWQRIRHNMKGTSTKNKIDTLIEYYEKDNFVGHITRDEKIAHFAEGSLSHSDCDVCIRIDNYIKALCRGGQLQAGAHIGLLLTLEDMIKK